MKTVYGYIRVSTTKQGESASLPEQKAAIIDYAKKNHLEIINWFEEKKTAAKTGRPLFTEMMKNLIDGKAKGVIMHKIDRSARNLHDWAAVGDLTDNGIEVHFAHESLDMTERGGRLSADIQAVMASDYVRNLRQETLKGLYGRLKQGIYPFGAPIGYLNTGKGNPKSIDPIQGKLIKQVFEHYATERYGVRELAEIMRERGLRNHKGGLIYKNGINNILKNTFYIGLMEVKGKSFKGKHKSIIDTRLFKKVQLILSRKYNRKNQVHFHLFRYLIKCKNCQCLLYGEKQKGKTYYRCQTKDCKTKTKREDHIERFLLYGLKCLEISKKELLMFKESLEVLRKDNQISNNNNLKSLKLSLSQSKAKKEALIEAYLETTISKEDFTKRKLTYLKKELEIEEKIQHLKSGNYDKVENIIKLLELCISPIKIYNSGNSDEKREFLNLLFSNIGIEGKRVMFTMKSPFREIQNRANLCSCPLDRDPNRTLDTNGNFMYPLCPLGRDPDRTLYSTENIHPSFIYSDIKTSPIVLKPLEKREVNMFLEILLNKTEAIKDIKSLNQYEI